MIRVFEISKVKDELDNSNTIVLFGPQCSGKTTLARELTDFDYVSLGEAVRNCNDENLLAQANELIKRAIPWPAELGLRFIESDIKAAEGRVIIDGFPRKLDEYKALRNWQFRNGLPEVDTFLEVTADRDILMARYALRELRGVESQRFFDLRYRQYREFVGDIANIAVRHIVYDTSNGEY